MFRELVVSIPLAGLLATAAVPLTGCYGPDKPVADNKTRKGKEANRRIEFKVQAQ